MQCGSTGLGKMALKMRLASKNEMTKLPPTEPPEGSLIMYCKTYDPVKWCVWISVEPEDLWGVIKIAFSRQAIGFVIKTMFGKILHSKKKVSKEDFQMMASLKNREVSS
jgi:hypothetical protein